MSIVAYCTAAFELELQAESYEEEDNVPWISGHPGAGQKCPDWQKCPLGKVQGYLGEEQG